MLKRFFGWVLCVLGVCVIVLESLIVIGEPGGWDHGGIPILCGFLLAGMAMIGLGRRLLRRNQVIVISNAGTGEKEGSSDEELKDRKRETK
jgi:hypothetical protein